MRRLVRTVPMLTRRGFLRLSALFGAVAGGLALAGCATGAGAEDETVWFTDGTTIRD